MLLAWYGYGYHDIMIVTYIRNLFSIKYYLVHILAKYWSSIAYIKRISTLQTFGHSQN